MDQAKWVKALGSLSAINADLPEEYRVIISDQKFKEMTKEDVMVSCKNCKQEILYNKIKILNVIERALDNLITSTRSSKVWYCEHCNTENPLQATPMKQTLLQQPYYLGVVPKPPKRADGLESHVNYSKHMERWCHTMLAELEAKMAQFRDDNWKRGDEEEFGAPVIDTSWEENDK